jgi:hypothetical protein
MTYGRSSYQSASSSYGHVFAEGKEDELLGRLQKKLGKNKDEVRQMIEKL